MIKSILTSILLFFSCTEKTPKSCHSAENYEKVKKFILEKTKDKPFFEYKEFQISMDEAPNGTELIRVNKKMNYYGLVTKKEVTTLAYGLGREGIIRITEKVFCELITEIEK